MDPHELADLDLADLDDEALIEAYRDGHGAAFRVLTQRYERPLYNYLLRLLNSRDDTDDAFQEVFLRVYRSLHRFETSRRFKPWLYTIASNLVKNIYRSRSVRRKLSLDRESEGEDSTADWAANIAGAELGPVERVARGERAALLRAAIEELPPKGRQALVLFYFEGFSYEDIAQIASVPLGTVKSRIHNATARLVKQLEGLKESLQPDGL